MSHPVPTIALHLHSLDQLFESLDPAPFRDKCLDPRAHRYILACASEFGAPRPLRMEVHLPDSARGEQTALANAIHTHFRLEHEEAEREHRGRMRMGRWALILGLAVLAACTLLRQALTQSGWAGSHFLDEGLLILGWVALWRPIEILLFERWESRTLRRWLKHLSAVPIEFRFPGPQPSHGMH